MSGRAGDGRHLGVMPIFWTGKMGAEGNYAPTIQNHLTGEEHFMKGNGSVITNERGAASLKLIIALVILAAVIYVGIKIIPIYYDHYKLEDTIKQTVSLESIKITEETPKKLKQMISSSLKEMNAQFQEEKNIKVEVRSNKIIVDVDYLRPHNIPGFPKQFHIHYESTPI